MSGPATENMDVSGNSAETQAGTQQQAGKEFTIEYFTQYMETKIMTKFTDIQNNMSRVDTTLGMLTGEVSRNGGRLLNLEQRVERLEGGTTASACPMVSLAPLPSSATMKPIKDDDMEQYDQARRSLLIFPVEGNTNSEILVNLMAFLTEVMGMERAVCNGGTIDMARRVGSPRFRPKEILVVFKEVSTRDSVIGRSGRLAEYVDSSTNKPTAGIRINVPQFLRGKQRTLESYGKRLRDIHRRNARTHIKFDDSENTLYLNVKLYDDEEWTRVSPENASVWLREMDSKATETINKRLNHPRTYGQQDVRQAASQLLPQAMGGGGLRPRPMQGQTMGQIVRQSNGAPPWTDKAGSSTTSVP